MRVTMDCCMFPWDAELHEWLNHLELEHAAPEGLTDVILGAILAGHKPTLIMTPDMPSRLVGLQLPLP